MIDGNYIESINNDVDLATTIIGLARYSDDYIRSAGPTMMFAKDNFDHHDPISQILRRPKNRANPAVDSDDVEDLCFPNPNYNLGYATRNGMLKGARRRFSCAIPLSHIFGFCRNVRKVIYGAKHTVVLNQDLTIIKQSGEFLLIIPMKIPEQLMTQKLFYLN